MISKFKLEAKVSELLSILYKKRFNKLEELKLSKLLNKNPYLYRATGFNNPQEYIEQLLSAFISSSDETIFGNDFFEPLATWAAQQADEHKDGHRTVAVGAGAGQDIAIETEKTYFAISVKSGKNIFNAQSTKGQATEFAALRARMRKNNKAFRAIIGYGYGRKASRQDSDVERVAGQVFWEMITGEADFYLRIADAMKKFARVHKADYDQAYSKKRNQLLKHFMLNFVDDQGSIAWNMVVKFNSSKKQPSRLLSCK